MKIVTRISMKKRNGKKEIETMNISERFGTFTFATEQQLVAVEFVRELLPKRSQDKHEHLFADCAELGAWNMLAGLNLRVSVAERQRAMKRAKARVAKVHGIERVSSAADRVMYGRGAPKSPPRAKRRRRRSK